MGKTKEEKEDEAEREQARAEGEEWEKYEKLFPDIEDFPLPESILNYIKTLSGDDKKVTEYSFRAKARMWAIRKAIYDDFIKTDLGKKVPVYIKQLEILEAKIKNAKDTETADKLNKEFHSICKELRDELGNSYWKISRYVPDAHHAINLAYNRLTGKNRDGWRFHRGV